MKTNSQKAGFLENAAVRSVLAALICILGGLVVGLIVLVLLTAFAEDISVAEAFSG